MTSILGRMATYSGQMIQWKDAIESNISLADADKYTSFQDAPPVTPDEFMYYSIPVPGVTKTV